MVSLAPPAKLRKLASIWTASSRVGARISARQALGLGRPGIARIWWRIGRPKAAVLPVPVWATPRMSRPAICGAMVCAWIGVGVSKPVRVERGEQRLREAEAREGRYSVTSRPFREARGRRGCRPRQAHVTKT